MKNTLQNIINNIFSFLINIAGTSAPKVSSGIVHKPYLNKICAPMLFGALLFCTYNEAYIDISRVDLKCPTREMADPVVKDLIVSFNDMIYIGKYINDPTYIEYTMNKNIELLRELLPKLDSQYNTSYAKAFNQMLTYSVKKGDLPLGVSLDYVGNGSDIHESVLRKLPKGGFGNPCPRDISTIFEKVPHNVFGRPKL